VILKRYGQPPTEIIQELAPTLELDNDGMPIINENTSNFTMPPIPFFKPPGSNSSANGEEDCSIM